MERDQYCHEWLGCIVGRFHRTSLDAEFHLQAASRAFFAYKPFLCDETARCEWQIACDFSMLWWHQLHFSELGTGQSTNEICKTWIVHFGSHFGRWFVLLLLIGPVLGMKFYILRKNETIRKQHDLRICPCKCWRQYWNLGLYIASLPTHRWVLMPTWPPWSGKSATSLAYQNDCFPPVQTTGQLGGCSHTRRNLVATYKRFCYVLQKLLGEWDTSARVSCTVYIFCLPAPKRGLPPGMQGDFDLWYMINIHKL